MAAGLINGDEYAAIYRWSAPQERDGAAQDVAMAVAAELDAQHPTIDWRKTAESLKAQV